MEKSKISVEVVDDLVYFQWLNAEGFLKRGEVYGVHDPERKDKLRSWEAGLPEEGLKLTTVKYIKIKYQIKKE